MGMAPVMTSGRIERSIGTVLALLAIGFLAALAI